jgi:hypothetical protein
MQQLFKRKIKDIYYIIKLQVLVRFARFIELNSTIHKRASFSSDSLNFNLATILFRLIESSLFFYQKRLWKIRFLLTA